YAMAVAMTLLGPSYLAGRLTAVFFSLLAIVGLYAWVRRAFDQPTALMAAAGLAVGFWGVMAARQSLRSITLPALFVGAIYFYWKGINNQQSTVNKKKLTIDNYQLPIVNFLSAGVLLGLSFYTYIPARGMWVLFLAVAGYVVVVTKEKWRQVWGGTAVTLVIALLVALPLLLFLRAHPELEVRIDELSVPLTALRNGDFSLLLANTKRSLQLFTVMGDPTWRYNLAGKPFLPPLMGALFYGGVGLALWWTIRPFFKNRTPVHLKYGVASFTALGWLLVGMAPVFVTGPELSMTQAIGMQPVLYLFPAILLGAIVHWVNQLQFTNGRVAQMKPYLWVVPLLLFGGTAVMTSRDYFDTWANEPEVRVQYESTMTAAINMINEQPVADAAISTITPGVYHSPALANMTLTENKNLRWFDGRYSLLLPQSAESLVVFPGFASLHPALLPYFETAVLESEMPLRETDRDRPLQVYRWQVSEVLASWEAQFARVEGGTAVTFGEAVKLIGYDLQTAVVAPGASVRLVTMWQIKQPIFVETRLFTHVLGPDGVPFAQKDQLDVPPENWQAGDLFLQLHEFVVPRETAVGTYPISIGAYTCPDTCENGQRFPILVDGEIIGDALTITTIEISE
ncbi:MAG: glycosyltransferase family 39 protein, partial [Chloroflexi bacterium]|nr:glycosyltransferase family 39 protein [Chloroflexota bacterium]